MSGQSLMRLRSNVDREPFLAAARRAFSRDLDATVDDFEVEIESILKHGLCSHATYDERHAAGMGMRGERR